MKKVIFFLIATLAIGMAMAQQPTIWRGANNGVYTDSGLLRSWPADGPNILWVVEGLGQGFSSPVMAHGKIFVSTMIDKTGYIFILNMDGKEVKRYAYGEEFFESYPGTRSTPVLVGDWLYIYSGYGVVYAFEALTGEFRWKKEILKDTDGENIRWGVTETLAVDGDMLFCSPGGKTQNVIAMDRNNGKMLWTTPGKGDLSAYCTPLIVNLPTRKLLVTMMSDHIMGIDAATGKLLWTYEQKNRWSVHANTPIFSDGALLCTSGYGKGSVKLKLSADGSSVSQEWFNDKLDSRHHGAVLIDGYIYSSGDNNREWRCVDFKTGEEKWASTEVGKGVVVAADGLLYMYSERGELAMAEASPTGFKLLGNTKVEKGTGQHWAHPVINNGILYLRHGDALIAYKI